MPDRREPITVPLTREPGCSCITPREAIAAAAAAGIALFQPDPCSAWLSDREGRPVFWWAAGETLYLAPFSPQTARCVT